MKRTDESTASMHVLIIFKLKDMTPCLYSENWGSFNDTRELYSLTQQRVSKKRNLLVGEIEPRRFIWSFFSIFLTWKIDQWEIEGNNKQWSLRNEGHVIHKWCVKKSTFDVGSKDFKLWIRVGIIWNEEQHPFPLPKLYKVSNHSPNQLLKRN